MTIIEARKIFKLRDTDKLNTEGILSMIKGTQEYLGTGSISKFDRENAEKELEALITLYEASL